ncbi:probable phosphoglycerate mutase [Fistulifera solaris]|uniref:Probable phosphoglycerate mutase n=1 Tax=Fistulifera solaris TaxID=1519565 RepID=A0A1Z5JAH6_FISSO|nr:probable phosphoglycerate mutase [Fistulifera solaris]|eukprot:GAX11004.1 probable phosphoglycerate mutase [Fistulifera solaris]
MYQRRIILVRHGETDWNKRGLMQGGGFDIELNENGKRQASRVALELVNIMANRETVILASSHLQRAVQTADVLQEIWKAQHEHLDIARITMNEFGEMRFGNLEGNALRGPEATDESKAHFRDNSYKMTQDKHVCWPGGGESTADVETRGLQGLNALTKKYPDADLLVIVAHGRFNKILLASLLYGNVLQYSDIEQGNTCINVIDQRKDGKYDQIVLNYLGHLRSEFG